MISHTVFDMAYKKDAKIQKSATQDTSWNEVSGWYDAMLESGEGTYQKDLILPNVSRMLGLKKGERVIDIGCGQGFFAREFFKDGAFVTGIDLSAKLIATAKEHSPKEIAFVCASASSLDFLNDGTFDASVCVSAIQNMENIAEVFEEISRVLKTGGRFVLVMNHPAFRVPKRSSWGFDESRKIQYRRVDEYISESESSIVAHPGVEVSASTLSFHRPLQFYFKALAKAGFSVHRLEEWTSRKQSELGPRANAENKARKEFPLFLSLEARKL